MKNILFNIGYFIKEAKTIIRLNLLSNVFSFLSTGLIFFFLAMVISGWSISNEVVETIKGEAEINIYFDEELNDDKVIMLADSIRGIAGVKEARLVDEDEAYGRMERILGKEACVLGSFEDNPFSPFIEVNIQMEEIDSIIDKLDIIEGIEHVRDNKDVLERIRSMSEVLKVLGYLILTAVGISTIVIISHIIRTGIYDNREQISTLRLMGAQEAFIAFPFFLEGLIITLAGGVLAIILTELSLRYLYIHMAGPLPFIPLPSREILTSKLIVLVISLSVILGIAGSLFGFSSAKSK